MLPYSVVNATPPETTGPGGYGGPGGMKAPAIAIKLTTVNANGATNEMEAYQNNLFGKINDEWFSSAITDKSMIVVMEKASNWGNGQTLTYSYGQGQVSFIHGSRVVGHKRNTGVSKFDPFSVQVVAEKIASGQNWQSLVNTPEVTKLAGEFVDIISRSELPEAVQALGVLNTSGASGTLGGLAYLVIVLAAMKASNNQLETSAIDTLFTTMNAAGSQSYVFIELMSLGVMSTGKCYSYESFYSETTGISPQGCVIPPVGIDAGSNPQAYNDACGNYMKSFVQGKSQNWPGGSVNKGIFFHTTGGNYNWGMTAVQVDGTTGKATGLTGNTFLGTFLTGEIATEMEGQVYIKANPKGQRYVAGTSVSADLTLDVLSEKIVDRNSQISKWKPGTKIELSLGKTNLEGTTSSDSTGKIVDSASKGVVNGNKITITPTSLADFTKWVDGTNKIAVKDSGLSSSGGFTLEYTVTANFIYPSETKPAGARGVEKKSVTIAADKASWIGDSMDTFYYHSSAGEEKAMGEVKNNTPNNENWEAMGGIPTTETAYVAAGGQTHQVDFAGRVGNNPNTSRTITIVVNVQNCWGSDSKCSTVCDGHSHSSPGGGCVISPAVAPDPGPPPKPGKPEKRCTSTSMTNTFYTASGPWSVTCTGGGETSSGTDTHSWQGTTNHEDKYCDSRWGDHCNNTWNHTHRQTCTHVYNIQIPIDAFNYLNMVGLDTNFLQRMDFAGNSALFTNPNISVTNNPVVTNFFDVDNYSSGNGRMYFDYDQKKASTFGNALYKWGNSTITINVNNGATSISDAGHSEAAGGGSTYPGANHSKCDTTADRIANEVRQDLESAGPYRACAVSDYAEIANTGSYQTIGYCEQLSIPSNWYSGFSFSGGGGTWVSPNRISWDRAYTVAELWFSNSFRTLWSPTDVATMGYNGNYSQVNNTGGMSGKFGNTGATTWGKYDYWKGGRGQPNAQSRQHGSNSLQVPMSAAGLNILRTYRNGQVSTGKATITYADAVTIGSPGTGGFARNNTVTCNYTGGQNGVNDIVIHDPVSVQYSEVLCNDSSLDQRTESSKILQGGDDPNGHLIYRDETTNTIDPGIAFINIGKDFKVRLSNKGDFSDSHTMGLASCTVERQGGIKSNGQVWGFVDGMDCTKWTKDRFVKFPVHVNAESKDGTMNSYYAGCPIEVEDLKPNEGTTDMYTFFVTTNSDEFARADAIFTSSAINSQREGYYDESNGVTNKLREGNKAAKHTATKRQTIDVVGFIGNLAINDTGDFRFAELFKQKSASGEWLIKNLVHEVDYKKPNQIVADPVDILQKKADSSTKYHSTFGMTYADTGGKAYPYKMLPLTPSDNPIVELQNQEMRPGYNLYMDVETIGQYFGENWDDTGKIVRDNLFQRMAIKPRYWSYDLGTKTYTPIDVYYGHEGSYNLIVPFDSDAVSYNSEWLYYLDWANESARRNYVNLEKTMTEKVVAFYTGKLQFQSFDPATGQAFSFSPIVEGPKPNKEKIGSANTLFLDSANRTFIGSNRLYGSFSQIGNNFTDVDLTGSVYDAAEFGRRSQRWQYTIGLPSSAVFVKQGQDPTKVNIDALANTDSVIVCALDIKVQGKIWALEYDGTAVNFADGIGYEIYPGVIAQPPKEPTGEYVDDPVVVVYNNKNTSEDDLRTEGTH